MAEPGCSRLFISIDWGVCSRTLMGARPMFCSKLLWRPPNMERFRLRVAWLVGVLLSLLFLSDTLFSCELPWRSNCSGLENLSS